MNSNPNYPYTAIYITGLFNLGTSVEADILSSPNNTGTTLNIPTQTIGGYTFYGQGTYSVTGSVGKITLNIDWTSPVLQDVPCIVTLVQQL